MSHLWYADLTLFYCSDIKEDRVITFPRLFFFFFYGLVILSFNNEFFLANTNKRLFLVFNQASLILT